MDAHRPDTVLGMSLAGRRCLVLGAGGFLGTHLCRALMEQNLPVRGFGRRVLFQDAIEGIEWRQGDFLDAASFPAIVAGCDTVFHLIGATTPSTAETNRVADITANVIPTLKLLDACVANGVRRVIFTSSGGTVYGNFPVMPIPETAPTEPISSYGIAKLTVEKYLAQYQRLYGLEYRILRIANAYGPFQMGTKGQGAIAAFLPRILAHQPIEIWGDGHVVRDYAFAADIAAALVSSAAHQGSARVFNIGSGQGHSLIEIVRLIEAIMGAEVRIKWRPARPVDVARNILDIGLAERELNWRPQTSLEDGLRLTLAWMKNRLEG